MPLIIKTLITTEIAPPENASKFCIEIPSKFLSVPYELRNGDKIYGEILEIKTKEEKFEELINKKITFILKKVTMIDYLFIKKKDWEENFREYGLVVSGFTINLKLNEVEKSDGEKIKLYTKKDLKIV